MLQWPTWALWMGVSYRYILYPTAIWSRIPVPCPCYFFLIADLSQVEIARSLNYLLYVSNFSLGSSGQPVHRDVSRLGNDLLFTSGDQVRCAGSELRVQGNGSPERHW